MLDRDLLMVELLQIRTVLNKISTSILLLILIVAAAGMPIIVFLSWLLIW